MVTTPATNVIVYGGGSLDQANDPQFRDPQATQWNFTVERQITEGTLLRAFQVDFQLQDPHRTHWYSQF